MRYAILSDIHGNLEALEKVLDDIPSGYSVVSLGDNIGYMANPNEVMDTIWELADHKVLGNHEMAVKESILGENYYSMNLNIPAKRAIDWTAQVLNRRNKERVIALLDDRTYQIRAGNTIFAHTFPADERFGYVQHRYDVHDFFLFKETDGIDVFIGHTHMPAVFNNEGTGIDGFRSSKKNIVVVPSVGQPRDGDNRAGYCLFDTETRELEMPRLKYDFYRTQKKILKAGLPERLAIRIEKGY